MRGQRGIRSRLQLVVLCSMLVGSVALVAGFNTILHARLGTAVDHELSASAQAQVASLETDAAGHVSIGEAPDDGTAEALVWTYDPTGRLLEGTSRAPASVAAAAQRLATGGGRSRYLPTSHVRLLAEHARRGHRTVATVVVGVATAPYERTEREALFISIGMAALFVAIALAMTRLLLAAILAPIERMTTDAAAWSVHELDRRFDLGPPRDEVTRLGATFDALLDRVASGMLRERRVTEELSHELRTPLTTLSAQAQLVLGDPDLPDALRADVAGIVESAAGLRDVVDTLLDAARASSASAGNAACDARLAIDRVAELAQPTAKRHGVILEAVRPSPVPVAVAVEPLLLERILMPLVENACRHARSRVAIAISELLPGVVEVTVSDDGPGVADEERDAIFEPGVRGAATAAEHDGSGLGLALSRRLARTAGGDVQLVASQSRTTFALRLPAA